MLYCIYILIWPLSHPAPPGLQTNKQDASDHSHGTPLCILYTTNAACYSQSINTDSTPDTARFETELTHEVQLAWLEESTLQGVFPAGIKGGSNKEENLK